MQRRNLIILGIAVLFGLIAVLLANSYFSGYEQRAEKVAKEQQLVRIVVASQELAFGTALTTENLRLQNWPSNSVPQGAFRTLEDALRDGRVSLRPIVIGEPVLASRVSGKDGRASIAYNLPEGMRAISIPVSAVAGVSGFAQPGDVVDVLLTRQIPGDGANGDDKMTDVIMENVQVLAVDQAADDKKNVPKVGKTAVLMVDLFGAQKLALAREVGSLSLALRNVENQLVGGTQTVSTRDLNSNGLYIAARPQMAQAPMYMPPPQNYAPPPRQAASPPRPSGPSMVIVRGTQDTTYEVNRNGAR